MGANCRGSKTDSRMGVGMRRQDPSYGEVVHMSLRVQALLRGSNSPMSRCPKVVDWIICVCVFTKDVNPSPGGGGGLYRVLQDPSSPTLCGVVTSSEKGLNS